MEPEFLLRFHKNQPLAPILSKISPVHALECHFLTNHLTSSSHLCSHLPRDFFPYPSVFPLYNRPDYASFAHPSNLQYGAQAVKLPTVQFLHCFMKLLITCVTRQSNIWFKTFRKSQNEKLRDVYASPNDSGVIKPPAERKKACSCFVETMDEKGHLQSMGDWHGNKRW